MRRLNILLPVHWMGPDGSGIFYLRLARKLKEQGHKVIVCSSGGTLTRELEKSAIKHYKFMIFNPEFLPLYHFIIPKFNLQKVKVPFILLLLDFIMRWNFFFLFELVKFLNVIKKEKVDILHSHGFGADFFSFLGSSITKRPWVSLVSTSYLRLPFEFSVFKFRVGKIIAVSEECKSCMNPYSDKVLEKKTIILPNPVDIEKFSPPRSVDEILQYEKEFCITHGKKNILLVSRLIPAKKDPIISTIKAAPIIHREFNDVQIIIAGDGELIGEVVKLADETNKKLKSNVILVIGFVNEIYKLMKVADIVIAIGQTATEAMACGKPVIIAGHRVGPKGGSFSGVVTKETIDEVERYYFTGRDSSIRTNPTVIAEACIELLKDKAKMEAVGKFNRHIAEQKFSMERGIIDIQKIYSELINRWANDV